MCQRDRAVPNPGSASGLSDELAGSYSRAVYRVDTVPSPVYLTVGHPSPELDRWLASAGVTRFAFLSAANPGSVRLADDENRRRHELLIARLAAIGLPAVAGESYDPADGGWREASVLVAGIEQSAALAVAREFGQAALLCGTIGEAVELVPAAAPAGEI